MAKRAGSESLAVEVYERLREAIFNSRFAPGERLKPGELGSEFGVSIGVMREALGMLASQKLVHIERNRGFHVARLSAQHLLNLTAARKVTEGAALSQSITAGDVQWEGEVLAAHHRLASEPMLLAGEPDAPGLRNAKWVEAHLDFHYKLIEACGNPVLLDLCVSLSDAAELYRSWSVTSTGAAMGTKGTARDIAAEHRALCDAAIAHEVGLAVALFEAHIERTAAILISHAPALADSAADSGGPGRPSRPAARGASR